MEGQGKASKCESQCQGKGLAVGCQFGTKVDKGLRRVGVRVSPTLHFQRSAAVSMVKFAVPESLFVVLRV